MGTTIGTIVISYDVNRLHTNVKEQMEGLGYFDNWHYGKNPTLLMPNTTLWHKQKNTDTAVNDLKIVCSGLGVNLEKALAVLAKEFVGI